MQIQIRVLALFSLFVVSTGGFAQTQSSDLALNHNRLIREKTGDGVYKLIGTYKVVGTSFLFGEKNKFPSEVKWHSAKNLTKANFSGFKIKAQCIFSEFLLSQDALLSDVKFVDVRNIKL